MKCSKCGSDITIYELYQRSYRLYVYMCKHCEKGFLAHHFDIDLDIFRLQDVTMMKGDGLIFIQGLKVEPRVFDFKVDRDKDAIVVVDEKEALGELVKASVYIYAAYNPKTHRRMCRILGCKADCIDKCKPDCLSKKVGEVWGKIQTSSRK